MANNTEKHRFGISGMSCAACASRIEKVLSGCEGVNSAGVNFAASTADVVFDPGICTPELMREAVRKAGYELIINSDTELLDAQRKKDYRNLKLNMIFAVILSIPVVIIGMFFMDIPYANLIMFILSTPVVFVSGSRFFKGAWKQLRHHTANMDTLVALSTGIAWLFSVANMLFPDFWLAHGIHPHVYFEASAVIIAFILLGRTLESKAKNNTSTAIKRLMGLRPDSVVLLLPDGNSRKISIEDVKAGDTIIVRPGERVPADGIVTEGKSYIDESMLSGEPVPVEKVKDSKVFAGTINGSGTFRFRAEKVGNNTLLSKIIEMVQDAQGSKAPVQQLVDKIAAIFVPVIICISIISFIIWILTDTQNGFTHGLLAAITVLIIACPCALGLATPTAIMVGIGKGAGLGILIKDAESLETAPKIDTVALDKTGTITAGKPTVSETIVFRRMESGDAILKAMEQTSEHPLAIAVCECIGNTPAVRIDEFENIPGRGIKARYDNEYYFAGNRKLIEENGIEISPEIDSAAAGLAAAANSLVWFANRKGVISLTGISDPIKEGSVAAIAELQSMGISVYMLTGDNSATAHAVAKEAGIGHYRAEMLPQNKAGFIKKLQNEGKRVAMVGDGINDSAALATADMGIAMGAGSDIAMEVAQITIISSDLTKIPITFRLSAQTVKTIHQNLFWAFIYNIIGVPIAAGILYPVCGFLLNPMIAGAAMAFSSVSVVCNSLLLKRKKFNRFGLNHKKLTHSHNNEPEEMNCDNDEINNHEPINREIMTRKFKVEGMSCSHCSGRVTDTIKALPGVTDVKIDLNSGTAEVSGDVEASTVEKAVSEAGYPCSAI